MAVDWNSTPILEKIRRGATRGVMIGIGIVEARAVYLTTQVAKTGKKYRRRGVVHQSSAPGEPFASDTGDAIGRRSIAFNPENLMARLSFHSKKASWLEHGTRKMKPRPFARRSLAETSNQVVDAIAGEIRDELRK